MNDLFTPPATAQQLAEKGIKESHDHAEQHAAGWSTRALTCVSRYVGQTFEPFLTEDVKAWAYENGLDKPPVDGAWGHVMRTAAKHKFIHRCGRREAKSPGSHGKPMALWARGPKPDNVVTASEANESIEFLERLRVVMDRECRTLFVPQLETAIARFKLLAS
jgi:hypothetical protein